jgi:ATP-dependent DNA helicase RecG
MTQEELIKVIAKGENEKIEFKEARNMLPRSFFETVCAFLITMGKSTNFKE